MIVFNFIIVFMVICTQLIIILHIDRTLLTLLLAREIMISGYLLHMLIAMLISIPFLFVLL